MDRLFITGYIIVRDNSLVSYTGEIFSGNKDVELSEFLKSVYQGKKMDYPKFYKMDNLCKLAFVPAEILMSSTRIESKYSDEELGIVFWNCSSSIDSDTKHVESFVDKSNYYPSPAVFVYTLPNIAIGEICIRHSIKGENALFISEAFDIDFSVDFIQMLLEGKKVQACIGGWIEYSKEGYEAFLYTVENESMLEQKHGYIPFSKEEVEKIYSK